MSFICEKCWKPSKRGISPVLMASLRPVEYNVVRVDPETEVRTVRTVQGTEIAHEMKLCCDCAGVPTPEKRSDLQPVLIEAQVASPFKQTLGAMALENLLARTLHQTKRAAADFEAVFPVLKAYEQRGGGI